MSNEPVLPIRYKDNIIKDLDLRSNFIIICNLFKRLFGSLIIQILPNTEIFYYFSLKTSLNIKCEYSIKDFKRNNLNIDFLYEIKYDNKNFNIISQNEFVLFLIINNELIDYLDFLKKESLKYGITENTTNKIIERIEEKSRSVKIGIRDYLIRLHDDNISYIVKLDMSDRYLMDIDNIHYKDILQALIKYNIRHISFYDIFELMYYNIVQISNFYEKISKQMDYLVINNHDSVDFENIYITPLWRLTNVNLDIEYINLWQRKCYNDNSLRIFNGRYFFPFNPQYYHLFSDFNFPSEYEIKSKSFLKLIKTLNLKNILNILDYFGVFRNQFATGLMNLEYDEENRKLKIICQLKTYNRFDYSNIDFVFDCSINNFYDQLDLIKKLYNYLKDIFLTYPLHSKIIALNDYLYYLNIYTYFPLYRKYQLPIVENSIELVDKISDLKPIVDASFITHKLFESENRTNFVNKEFIKDKPLLIRESIEVAYYVEFTKILLTHFGLDFGTIDINAFLNNEQNVFLNRKNNKNIITVSQTVNKDLLIKDLKKKILYFLTNGYYYDITYFIENFLQKYEDEYKKPKLNAFFKSSIIELYNDVKLLLTNTTELRSYDYSTDFEFFIVRPIYFDEQLNNFLHAGVDLLFKRIKSLETDDKQKVLIIKLNKLPFSFKEIEILRNFISSSTLNSFDIIENLNHIRSDFLNDYEKEYGIIINGIEIDKLASFFLVSHDDETIYNLVISLNETYKIIFERENEEYLNSLISENLKDLYEKLMKT